MGNSENTKNTNKTMNTTNTSKQSKTSNTMNIGKAMKGLLYGIIGTVTMMSCLTSCDQHEMEDLSWHSWEPGMVYATNGKVSSYEECVANGNTPEAVIFHIDNTGETDAIAYAVTLKDCDAGAFCNPDTTYFAQGTSADYGALDGESNTSTLRYFQISSPIAQNVEARYFIPSVAEMYKLYYASYLVNYVLGQCGGDALPITDRKCWYWTSTECEGQSTDRAWCFSLFSGRFESADKHHSYATRPIMKIRLNKAEQQ